MQWMENNLNLKSLSKTVSYFLRHNPWEIELEPDPSGWVPLDHLLSGLKRNFPNVTIKDIKTVIDTSDKVRFEIKGSKIRATYGHSLPKKIIKEATKPPGILYHGTATSLIDIIMDEGLKPMNRQYVHLSKDIKTAKVVGSRKGEKVVVIMIDAATAVIDGIKFYEELNGIWLADNIPAAYLKQGN